MQFPRVVFIVPGPLPRHKGTFGQEVVKDQDDFDAAIKAGFFETLPAAIEDYDNPKEPGAVEGIDASTVISAPKRGRPPKAV